MSAKSGSCLCGAVRFTVASVEAHHHACHCGMCRRWVGGPLLAALATGVSFQAQESLRTYSSSEWAERGFCATCGSSLFYRLKPTDQYFVSVGSLNDAGELTLAREIYVDHKPAGYAFAGDRPRLTEADVLAEFAAADSVK